MLLIALTVTLGTLPLFAQYGDYLFRSDYFMQLVPFIMETKRMMASGTPWWSWNSWYGDNFIGSYSYYTITSPFVWPLLLLPYGWVVKGCFVMLVMKYICAFLTSRLYLRKMGITTSVASVGGLLYAFSSFSVSQSSYSIFFEPLIVFPLLLIAVERFIRKEHYGCVALAAASFLVVFINYYFAVCSFLAAVLYLVCRLVGSNVKVGAGRIALGLAMVSLGVLADAFILFPTAMQLAGSPRTGSFYMGFNLNMLVVGLERFRVLFMPQVLEAPTSLFCATSWNSTSVCLPVVGMLPVLLYVWHNRRSWITLLVVVALLFFLSPLNAVFSMFTNTTYTRWAYALCLFLILPTCRWLDEGCPGLRPHVVEWYASFCIALLAFTAFRGYWKLEEGVGESRSIQLACYVVALVVSLVALWLFSRRGGLVRLSLGIGVSVAVQMVLLHSLKGEAYCKAAGDEKHAGLVREYLVDNHLPRLTGDMHYRTAFGGRFDNLAHLLNRPSVRTYHSIQNNVTRKLLCASDTVFKAVLNRFTLSCNQRSTCTLMSVKEVIAFDDPHGNFCIDSLRLTKTGQGDGYTIYNNVDYLPMGFTYDSYVEAELIDTLYEQKPVADVPLQLLCNLSVEKSDEPLFAKYLRHGKLELSASLDSVVAERRKCVASSFTGTTTGFTSEITLPREDIVFYSCPADKGFSAYVDGRPTDIHSVNLGLSAVIVPKGSHTVEFRFFPRGLKAGMAVSLAAFMVCVCVGMIERRRMKP